MFFSNKKYALIFADASATCKTVEKAAKTKTVNKPRKIRLTKKSNPGEVVSFKDFESCSQFDSHPGPNNYHPNDCWLSDSSKPEVYFKKNIFRGYLHLLNCPIRRGVGEFFGFLRRH